MNAGPANAFRGALRGAMRDWASLIKLSHSVFALPFALLSLLVATGGRPSPRLLVLCVLAVVAARSAAMAYNRFVDRDVDAANPRTAGREIPRGAIAARSALWFAAGSGALFVLCCALLGPWCGWLSPPVLGWLLLYSHSKRFTALCHLWLGTALGLAPVAAWVAARNGFDGVAAPLLLGAGVACWVAGFDVLYACQDEAFDRGHGLRSIPARLGASRAMLVSRVLHAAAIVLFALFGVQARLGWGFAVGIGAAALLLLWQHRLLRPGDLRRIHAAFFTANGALSVAMLAAACADLYLFG